MATIKSFTSLEQSKILAEILPIESADMWWAERYAGKVLENGEYIVSENPVYYLSLGKPSDDNYSQDRIKDIPCWSLAALLNYLREIDFFPQIEVEAHSVVMYINYYNEEEAKPLASVHNIKVIANTFVDACYEMILKLNERKIL